MAWASPGPSVTDTVAPGTPRPACPPRYPRCRPEGHEGDVERCRLAGAQRRAGALVVVAVAARADGVGAVVEAIEKVVAAGVGCVAQTRRSGP